MAGKDRFRALLTEPLLHFALIGTAVFLLYGAPNPQTSNYRSTETVITVTTEDVDRLAGQFVSVWNRTPNPDEVAGLIESHIRDEVLYREAMALGLDEGDAVIRQRLRLKMEFIGESVTATLQPSEADLAMWHAQNADRFTPAARIGLQQIMLESPDDLDMTLAALAEGADPQMMGRATMLPSTVEGASEAALDGTFGPGFFASVATLPVGTWTGPIESSFGWHAVNLTAVDRPAAPPLSEVRDVALAAWRQSQAETLREAQYQALRARYDIRLPEMPE